MPKLVIGLSYAPLMYNIIGWLIVLGYGVVAFSITLNVQANMKNSFTQKIYNGFLYIFRLAWLPISVVIFSVILTYFLSTDYLDAKYTPIVILVFLSIIYPFLQHFRDRTRAIRDIRKYFSLVRGRQEELHISDFQRIIEYSDHKPQRKLKVRNVNFSSGELNGVELKLHERRPCQLGPF